MGRRRNRKAPKRERLPQSHNKARGPAGRAPLLVIAGLPATSAKIVEATIDNDRSTRWSAIAGAFSRDDAAIYADPRAMTDLLGRVCAFAIEGRAEDPSTVDPTRVVLAYVPAGGDEALWDGFGHSAWPLRLQHPDGVDADGSHWRHDPEMALVLARQAIATAEGDAVNSVRFRLEARRTDDPLLLPARNYMTDAHGPLVDAYRLFLQGALNVAAVEARVTRKRFPFELLPKFYAKAGGQKKTFAYDKRGLVFPRGAGQHGAHHLLPEDDLSPERLRRELEGRFRFGTPLEPPGFQHDVQWEKAAALVREHFECVDLGAVSVSGDHANVYGNDVVKAETVTALKK